MITDIGAVLDEETEHVASEPAQRITTRPSPEGRKPTRWRGSVEETSIIESDLEPNIVTSRPINIINLEEDADTTTSRRGITTSARITISPRPTTIELPHAAITDGAEFGFETENTLPSSMVTLIIITSTTGADTNLFSVNFKFVSLGQNRTTAAVSTTLSASYSSTEGASYTMPSSTIPTLSEVPEEKGEKEEDEEEEEEEKEGKKSTQVVTKIRPTNFGDENMIRARIEPEMLQQQITTLPEERDMNEVTSILPAITTATQATSIGPNIAISEVTSSTSLSTSESNLPPFEAIPGVFEEQRMTFAQEEFSTASEGARKMITTASFLREEEQLPPDTFIKPKGQCPTPNDDSDRNRTDVLFLLDSSNSFNEHKFMHAIQLILDTVSHFGNIGPDGTQVSLVQYNSEPYLEFSLRKHNCKQSLIDDIADTDYMQVAKKNNLTVLVIATLEANPSYLVELAETAELDAIRVVDDHSVLTIALPIDEEMEQPEEKQEKEEERMTEAKENVGKTGLETGTSAISGCFVSKNSNFS
uniref:VWFA domain-containing protein n=1 Tax=Angiostrongylus cantonensis TaxID=6313 RepID=A0A0K0D1L5_ANGCA